MLAGPFLEPERQKFCSFIQIALHTLELFISWKLGIQQPFCERTAALTLNLITNHNMSPNEGIVVSSHCTNVVDIYLRKVLMLRSDVRPRMSHKCSVMMLIATLRQALNAIPMVTIQCPMRTMPRRLWAFYSDYACWVSGLCKRNCDLNTSDAL